MTAEVLAVRLGALAALPLLLSCSPMSDCGHARVEHADVDVEGDWAVEWLCVLACVHMHACADVRDVRMRPCAGR